MKNFFEAVWVGFVLGFLVMVVGVGAFVSWYTKQSTRADAIKAKVAHYEVDPTTGVTTFVYNTPVEAK